MAYIRFSISNGTIGYTEAAYKRRVFTLPDGSKLFHVALGKGLDVLLSSKPAVQVGEDYFRYEYTIFDKSFSVHSSSNFGLMFLFCDGAGDAYNFDVEVLSGGSRWTLGWLALFRDGSVRFKKEPVQTDKIRRVFEKAKALYG